MQLGRGSSTDVDFDLRSPATDIIGHSYGTEGAEMCLQLFSLDRDLGDFFRLLDSKGIDYMVVLTADHGGQDIPERRRLQGVPGAARVDAKLTAKDIGAAVGAQLGLKGPVLYGEGTFGDMYVDRALSPADQARAKAAAVAAVQGASAGRSRVHQGAAGRSSFADRAAERMEPDRQARGQASIPSGRATSSSC